MTQQSSNNTKIFVATLWNDPLCFKTVWYWPSNISSAVIFWVMVSIWQHDILTFNLMWYFLCLCTLLSWLHTKHLKFSSKAESHLSFKHIFLKVYLPIFVDITYNFIREQFPLRSTLVCLMYIENLIKPVQETDKVCCQVITRWQLFIVIILHYHSFQTISLLRLRKIYVFFCLFLHFGRSHS